jgi:putative glutamine amidotransferase
VTTNKARPRIGISCGFAPDLRAPQAGRHVAGLLASQIGLDYSGGVEEAGGLPLVVPIPYRLRQGPVPESTGFAEVYAAQVLEAVDGLLLSGGPDLDPEYFGEDPILGLGRVDAPRDALEMSLARAALAGDMPILAICRGAQILAVAAGGGLYQDLASQKTGSLKHSQDAAREATTHFVTVEPGTLLAGMLRAGPVKVNSFHHQAISRPPAGFRVSATAPDGVIEAIEDEPDASAKSPPKLWRVGVQWHPENLWAREPLFLNLFTGLVEAARRYRGSREAAI